MTRVALLVLAATACTTPPPANPSPPPTVHEILGQMHDAYAAARSYSDEGSITISGTTSTIAFRTTFVHPDQMRFELFATDPVRRLVIWSNGATTLVESATRQGRVDEADKLATALGAIARMSEGTSVLVPEMLVGGPTPFLVPSAPQLVDSEIVDGHDCWRVDGILEGRSWSLWIDKALHVARRSTTPRPSGSYVTIHYEPVVNGSMAAVEPISRTGKTVVDGRSPLWIGVRFDGTTTRVQQVIGTGPSARVGLIVGDEILSVDGAAVSRSIDVIDHVRHTKAGTQLALKLRRNGATVEVAVKPEPMPAVDKLAHDALIDKPAPDFALPVVNGIGSGALAAMANDVVVVDFWATWCKPCELMIPHLHELQAKHGARLHVVAISADEPQEIADYLTTHQINYTVARDADGKINAAYLVGALPMTVVIAKGYVRFVGVGVGDETELDATIAKTVASP